MTHRLYHIALTFAITCVLGLGATALVQLGPAQGAPSAPAEPRPVTVRVTGDAADGFDISYSDRTGRSPPSGSAWIQAQPGCSPATTDLG